MVFRAGEPFARSSDMNGRRSFLLGTMLATTSWSRRREVNKVDMEVERLIA